MRIMLNLDKPDKDILEYIRGSIIEASEYETQEDCIQYITTNVMFTPLNMDKTTGTIKKREFAIEVLHNDLFPHCKTLIQRIQFLGYMANKLINCALGRIKCDDRDSYI
jgi:DNA-directed RNA polymerase beta subunit